MKAVVSKAELASIISKIQNVIPSKPAIPIVANVLIEAIDGQLILNVTDLTTSMKCFTEATVIEEGSLVLPAKKFFQLVKEFTSPQIKISTNQNNTAEIVSGSSLFKINGTSKSEFPTIQEFSGNAKISFPQNKLKEMLYKVIFSAARENTRYTLNSIYLRIANQKMTIIGTDGKRFARTKAEVDIDPSFQGEYLLPLKTAEEMIKMLGETDTKTSLCFMSDKIFLENENLILMTKLLTGQYPDTEKIIPENINKPLVIHKEELCSLLRQISLFASEETCSVRFTFLDGILNLTANGNNMGEGKVSMPVDYRGNMLEIAFNPFFFIDILKHSKDETINLSVNDSYTPGVITDSSTALFVIMPMRLSETTQTQEIQANDIKDAALT